jgi:hypothetical protein
MNHQAEDGQLLSIAAGGLHARTMAVLIREPRLAEPRMAKEMTQFKASPHKTLSKKNSSFSPKPPSVFIIPFVISAY